MARERKYEVVDNSETVAALVAKVAERGFTPLQEHFGNWVVDQSGVSYGTKKEEAAARFAAKMALVLRMEHQKSPENHAFKAEQAEARAAERDEAAEARANRKAAKAEAAEEAPKPARRGRAKAEPVEEEAPAPRRRGRPAKAAAADTGEAKASAPARPAASARPARRPAASGRAGSPARRGKGGTEPAF